MNIQTNTWSRVVQLIELARGVTSEVDEEIDRILQLGNEQPLERYEAVKLLTAIAESLRDNSRARGDIQGVNSLAGDINGLVNEIIEEREDSNLKGDQKKMNNTPTKQKIALQERNGIKVAPIFPTPFFHEKEVPMNGGFVKTTDIKLWEYNDRLDIHIHQFKQLKGRAPDDIELLEIMLSKMPLPGVTEKDQFKIMELARSIANNGLRRPPIIDIDGTLLDGNRRFTACNYILRSNEFTSEQKARVEYIYVWQLTEFATNDDRRRVVVSMNFEKDCKQDWPEYVKASKIYEDWQAMLALEPYASATRQRDLLRQLSQQYALGPDTSYVKRYIRMMEEAEEFEAYLIDERGNDEYEVKHKSSEYFQYFDELTKGRVANTLDEDQLLCNLVYDLLFEDKFLNWKQIRDLPRISKNEEARKYLREARAENDVEEAQDKVVAACALVQITDRESRMLGANDRIISFTKFLMQIPVGAFADGTIGNEALNGLQAALEHVNKLINDNVQNMDHQKEEDYE